MTEYNKVVYDGQTLIDLTQDDVTDSDVLDGVSFHKANGARSLGTLTLPEEIFWATYGVTTSAEIESAYQDGKQICSIYGNYVYYFAYRQSATKHHLFCNMLGNTRRISCENDVWSDGVLSYLTTATSTPTADTVSRFDSDAHMNSEDMTSQEVDDFVDSLNVTGINAVDYVVEQGTSGIWTYRKWNSGVAECWGEYVTSAMTVTRAFGSIYTHQTQVGGVAYPFTFTSVPYEIETIKNANCWIMYQNVQTTTTSKTFWIARPSSYSTSGAYYIDIYVKGTWK